MTQDTLISRQLRRADILYSRATQDGPWKAILLPLSALICLISLFMLLTPLSGDPGWPLGVSIASLTWLACYFACSYGQFRTPYLFTSAYVFSLSVFHLGITVPAAFGIVDVPLWESGPMASWFEQAGWYTALSLGAIGIGFALSIKFVGRKSKNLQIVPELAEYGLKTAFWDGVGLLVASGLLMAFAIYSVGNFLGYSRTELFQGVGDTRGLVVFLMIFPSSAVLMMIGANSSFQYKCALIVAALAFLVVLLSGYRSMVLFPTMVGVIVWIKIGKQIPTSVAITGIIFVLVAIPVIGNLRALGSYETIDRESFLKASEGATIKEGFTEMGATAGVFAHVLRLVPDVDPYRYGSTYLLAIAHSIPNVGGDISESARKKAKSRSILDPDVMRELHPSDWLTYRIAPDKFKVGQGVGFSTIGEAYLNFGITGVIVFFVLIGYLLGQLDRVPLLNHPKLLVFVSAMLWPLMKSVRNDISVFIKPLVFTLIILAIWRIGIRFTPFGAAYKKPSHFSKLSQREPSSNPRRTPRVLRKKSKIS
ncbi:MAG TPA: O-antigen polysaccharide polymerase Wzy, partial [Gammaproteobacteria bacterium]|nr:O-antigen polysaccharide polymerase Wzy [Gammaproteobacteria bacterium]